MHLDPPADTLRQAYDSLARLADDVDAVTLRVERDERVPRADVERAVDRLADAAARCFGAQEERVVFPLVRATGAVGERFTRELADQHAALAAAARKARAEAAAGDGASEPARRQLAHDARQLTLLVRRQVEVEARRFLPLLQALPQARRLEIAETFAGGEVRAP